MFWIHLWLKDYTILTIFSHSPVTKEDFDIRQDFMSTSLCYHNYELWTILQTPQVFHDIQTRGTHRIILDDNETFSQGIHNL